MSVTWLDVPGSVLPSKDEPLNFVVTAGGQASSGPTVDPSAPTGTAHLAATTWTQLYAENFTVLSATTIASTTPYDYRLTDHYDVNIDGKVWRAHVPRRGELTGVTLGPSGLQMAINATRWSDGVFAGPFFSIDPAAQFGYTPGRALCVLARVSGSFFPKHRTRYGVSSFQLASDAVAAGTHVGAGWTGDGSSPYDVYMSNDPAGTQPGLFGSGARTTADLVLGPTQTWQGLGGLAYWGTGSFVVGFVRDSLARGYGLFFGPQTTANYGEMPPADPKVCTAFGRIFAPDTTGPLRIGFVGGMDGSSADVGGAQLYARLHTLRVFEGV